MAEPSPFARLMAALEPWHQELVLVGGWAHRLHHLHDLAEPPRYQPLTTLDADLAFTNAARLEGSIKARLVAAGFAENLSGEHRPPVAHYALGEEDAGFHAEFLTPLVGSGIKRTGRIDATLAAGGVSAQKLRHLELLLVRPWSIALTPDCPVPMSQPMTIRVANPCSFMAQKMLIHDDRRPEKRSQDILYLHDTLVLFGGSLDALRTEWQAHLAPTLTSAQRRQVERCLDTHFSSVTDAIRRAALIPGDRSLVPERVLALCQQGLREVYF